MTGFGAPCGACKFLRRKCAKGCVFAPYFCHEQGSAHFAAIHKVFGARNASNLLMHIPVSHRPEAAVTISYEAQARLQDPIYGCVSHIFALQQQVAALQAQLVSLNTQAAQRLVGNNTLYPQPDNLKDFSQVTYEHDSYNIHSLESLRMAELLSNPNEIREGLYNEPIMEHDNAIGEFTHSMKQELQYCDDLSQAIDPLAMQMDAKKFLYQEMDNWGDLEPLPVSYLQNS